MLRRDHAIPQFILKEFRPKNQGRTYFAERGVEGVRLKPVKDIFFEDHGERLLAREPVLMQVGGVATLASEPAWTEVPAEKLKKLENRWAHAIRGIVRWNTSVERDSQSPGSGFIEVKRGPDEQEDWVPLVADYCLRTMFRSGEAAKELWERYRENEERDLAHLIERQLGKKLTPSPELRELIRKHNRAQTVTGALADDDGIFSRHNLAVTIAVWRAGKDENFIIGSRGGCWVEHEGLRELIFPVHPKIGISIASREAVSRLFPGKVQAYNPGAIIGHNMPGRTGLSARMVNRAMWASCESVAGITRGDIEHAMRE